MNPAVAALGLVVWTGCAGAAPDAAARSDDGQRHGLGEHEPPFGRTRDARDPSSLRGLDPQSARARLEAGFSRDERIHVGFYEVSLAQCIDRVLQALADDAAGEPGAARALDSSLALYWEVRHWLAVRRVAGTAACFPSMGHDGASSERR